MKKNIYLISVVVIILLLFLGCASTNSLNFSTVAKGNYFTAFKANNFDASKPIEQHSYIIIIQEHNSISELNGQPVILEKEDGLTLNNIAVIQPGSHKFKVRRTFDYVIDTGPLTNTFLSDRTYHETEINFTFQAGKIYQLVSSQLDVYNPHLYNFSFREIDREKYDPRRDNVPIKDTTGTALFIADEIPLYSVADGIIVAVKRDIQY